MWFGVNLYSFVSNDMLFGMWLVNGLVSVLWLFCCLNLICANRSGCEEIEDARSSISNTSNKYHPALLVVKHSMKMLPNQISLSKNLVDKYCISLIFFKFDTCLNLNESLRLNSLKFFFNKKIKIKQPYENQTLWSFYLFELIEFLIRWGNHIRPWYTKLLTSPFNEILNKFV